MNPTAQQKATVAVLLAGTLLAVLNQTLLTPALPTIMSHLNVSATTAQWLTSGYSLVEAVIVPLNAYLLGRFSTRRLYIGGIGIFTLGSIACACAPGFPFLMAGRVLQAIATGIALPTVFTLILLIFPREKRGSAMGLIGLILSFAPALGPSISGVLVDTIGWRALFVLVAVIAIAVIAVSLRVLKNFEGFERTTFDVPSVVIGALGMVFLLYGLSTFSSAGTPAISAALIAAGLVAIALFARRQLHLEVPLLNVSILRHRQFRVAVICVGLLEMVLIGSGVILPLYVQNGLGDSATVSGLIMLPGALIGAACGMLAGRLFDRFGIRKVCLPGAAVLIVGVIGYFDLGSGSGVLMIGIAYTIACIGLQTMVTPVNAWGINALPNKSVPHGNAIVSTMELVGGSVGTAFTVSLTAFSSLVVPAGASAAESSVAGCHIAFGGLLALAVVIGCVFLFCVRDEKAPRETADRSHTGTPGVDRPWLVADVMNAQADALPEHATVREAIVLMQGTETGGLPIVTGNGTVAGFISDGDILKAISRHQYSKADVNGYRVLLEAENVRDRLADILGREAAELGTRKVVSVDAGEDAEAAFRTLAERRIKKVPVTSGGKFAGTLSRRNIMRALTTMEGTISARH